MAHFAELNEDNIVVRVIVISNEDCQDSNGNESEEAGIDFIVNKLNLGGTWKQTSYNNNIRNTYAGIGFTYNEVTDEFIKPAREESVTLAP
jgi:hypothetical protein